MADTKTALQALDALMQRVASCPELGCEACKYNKGLAEIIRQALSSRATTSFAPRWRRPDDVGRCHTCENCRTPLNVRELMQPHAEFSILCPDCYLSIYPEKAAGYRKRMPEDAERMWGPETPSTASSEQRSEPLIADSVIKGSASDPNQGQASASHERSSDATRTAAAEYARGLNEGLEEAATVADFAAEACHDWDKARALRACAKTIREQKSTPSSATRTSEPAWIEWNGGESPVTPSAKVEYRLRDGYTTTWNAMDLSWRHDGGPSDIVTYRVRDDGKAK